MNTKGGGYAEVAVVQKQSVFLIPESLSFEEAATIPLAGNGTLSISFIIFVDSSLI